MKLGANRSVFLLEISGCHAELLVTEINGVEGISDPYSIELSLVSRHPELGNLNLIRKPACITIRGEDEDRVIHGLVASLVEASPGNRYTEYAVKIVPKLWFLQYREDCRTYQKLTVPEIVEQVLVRAEFQKGIDFEFRLTEDYEKETYIVQFNESDLNFVSRLLEKEGIFYYFEHTADSHKLIFVDRNESLEPIVGDTLAFHMKTGMVPDEDCLDSLKQSVSRTIGKVVMRDYNFHKPSLNLEVEHTLGDANAVENIYPGGYKTIEAGQRYARIRCEMHQTKKEIVTAGGTYRTMIPGYTAAITDHPVKVINKAYIITQVIHEGRQPQGSDEYAVGEGAYYRSRGVFTPKATVYRPQQRHKAPKMPGKQTAVVTGPAGEEIYTDEYGRVKVQFKWDREGKLDENSSRWVRVMQTWAGPQWGSMVIPRIGQEVTIDYLNGDANHPVVTGVVYHGKHQTPYKLPDHKTRLGFKTNSTPGGGGFNEFTFEDKKDQEVIMITAEKDLDVRIKNDRREHVVGDNTVTIYQHDFKHIKQDQHIKVDQNHERAVKGDYHETVLDTRHLNVDGEHRIEAKDMNFKSGDKVVLESDTEITFVAGGSSITITQEGVFIDGKTINVQGPSGQPLPVNIITPERPGLAEEADDGNPLRKEPLRKKSKSSSRNKEQELTSPIGQMSTNNISEQCAYDEHFEIIELTTQMPLTGFYYQFTAAGKPVEEKTNQQGYTKKHTSNTPEDLTLDYVIQMEPVIKP
ncbi:type VI secretion system Vgr family protein [Zooshikella harenae]|uniref:Type VI secretion system tip protein VgrG n=1 Tax=Zooshikella harenae TaxID=2827238 RepID=A0ABS5ZI51_9GAMM|nr:type VI secretion system tip protein TssI/VgrG [Zooshikella harenae]MBU2713533.1 type VI secretion system tip protein VgrG [Zooshikella harenae]